MAKVNIVFKEGLRSEGSMEGARSLVLADTPKVYGGLEEEMSATDLFAFSLGACMLTMMGIKAGQLKVDLTGARAEVEKQLVMKPILKVGKFTAKISVPATFSEEIQQQLEEAARHCPIHLSLSPEVEQILTFEWGE